MTSLTEAINLLTGTPVFHLITLFALTFMLYAAWGQIRARGSPQPFPNLHWAIGGVLVGQIVLMIATLLALSGVFLLNSALPPLERFVGVASLGLLAFAFVPILIDARRVGAWLAAANAALALIVYAAIAPVWYTASQQATLAYNQQDTGWQVWSIALAALAALAVLVRRRGQWAFVFIAFALLAAGHALQFALADPRSDVAGWVRFAQLAAYPLLAATVYREYLDTRQEAAPRPDSSARLMSSAPDPWPVLEATRQIGKGGDATLPLQRACAAIATALRADLAAIGLPGDKPNLVELVAIHHPGAAPTPGATFAIEEQPAVKRAVDRRRPVSIGPEDNAADVSGLFGLMGSFVPGPLLIQPLLNDQTVLGVLLLGNPKSGRAWSAIETQQARSYADLIAYALSLPGQIESYERHATELTESMQRQANEFTAQRAALEAAAQQARDEAVRLKAALAEAEARTKQAQRKAEELAALVQAQEAEMESSSSLLTAFQDHTASTAERERLEAQLHEARDEAERLTALQSALETQLKHAQQQITGLNDELERKTVIAQTASVGAAERGTWGIIVSDTLGRVVEVSDQATRLIGRRRQTLIGQPIASVLADSRWRSALDLLTHARDPKAAGEPPFHVDVQVGGGTLHAELTPFKDSSGTTLNGIIAALRGEAESDDRQRDEVLASIAQELRTPMTSITGYTDLLLSESVGILGAMQRQFLQRVKANTERMGALLNDLIGVTAIDTGTISFEPEPIDAVEVIEEAIMASSAQYRERGIAIQLDIDEDLPKVQADRDSLHQILSHLLSNACAITPGGREVVVGAHMNPEAPDYALISVTDCGGGIAPLDRQRVFNRLYRADNPLIEGLGETGVGMSIARALVEAHGGRIWVDSDMGQGATFTFIVPVAGRDGSDVTDGIPA